MKKMALVLFTVLALGFGLTSCGGEEEVQAKETLTIGMSFQEMKNEYFVVMNEALQELGASLGATVYTADASHDIVKQVADVEDLLQKGVDILIINPTDSAGIKSAVELAASQGVTIVSVDAQAEGPVTAFVGSKNYDAGVLAGHALAEAIGESGEVAILDGIPVVPILERVRGFRDAVAEYPNIEIVTMQNGRQERDVALSVTENMIQANPNLVGIFSVNDEGSLGVLRAIDASGKDIKLTSVDGNPEAVAAIAEGGAFVATAAQYPRDMIRIGVGMALAKHWGANVVPAEVPIDVNLIDASNAASFSW